MRIPLIAGNWKMNTTVNEAISLVREMLSGLEAIEGAEKAVCPPFVSLPAVSALLKGSSVRTGAQNMYYEDKGAYTGEISPVMLAGLCELVILGHSERRQYFAEGDEIVNRKVVAALRHGLDPIMCVGEKLAENESGSTNDVIARQIRSGLAGIAAAPKFVIAYEPVWAIGTGKAATVAQAESVCRLIRGLVSELWGTGAGDTLRILYGGSVTAANIGEFVKEDNIDGALVGGASLKAADFIAIVERTAAVKSRRG